MIFLVSDIMVRTYRIEADSFEEAEDKFVSLSDEELSDPYRLEDYIQTIEE